VFVISHYLEHGMTGGLAGDNARREHRRNRMATEIGAGRHLGRRPGALKRYRYWLEMFYRLRPKPSPYHLEFTNPGD